MENAALNYGVCFDNCLFYKEMLRNEPDKAMLRFYSFLVQDLLTYWAPCFVLHLLQQRISFGLECLCTLSFTETPGSLINILNLFDFTANNCPLFISEQRYNHSYFPKGKIFDYLVHFFSFYISIISTKTTFHLLPEMIHTDTTVYVVVDTMMHRFC